MPISYPKSDWHTIVLININNRLTTTLKAWPSKRPSMGKPAKPACNSIKTSPSSTTFSVTKLRATNTSHSSTNTSTMRRNTTD